MGAPASRLQHIALALPRGHTEIGDLDVLVRVEEKILWLKVPVSDVETMTVIDAGDNLLKIPAGLVRMQPTLRDEIVEELTPFDILQNQKSTPLSAFPSCSTARRIRPTTPLTSPIRQTMT